MSSLAFKTLVSVFCFTFLAFLFFIFQNDPLPLYREGTKVVVDSEKAVGGVGVITDVSCKYGDCTYTVAYTSVNQAQTFRALESTLKPLTTQ